MENFLVRYLVEHVAEVEGDEARDGLRPAAWGWQMKQSTCSWMVLTMKFIFKPFSTPILLTVHRRESNQASGSCFFIFYLPKQNHDKATDYLYFLDIGKMDIRNFFKNDKDEGDLISPELRALLEEDMDEIT